MKIKLLLLFISISTLGFSQKLYNAVENADIDKVKALIEKGEDVNEYHNDGLFPLWRSAADNNFAISLLLLKNGAKVNQIAKVPPANSTAIEIPCQEGYLEIVKLLVENGADVNFKGYVDFTPIRIAARNGHFEIVKYLAENGAKIDVKAKDGATSLEHAASKGHIEIVRYLAEKGADVNNIDADGDFSLGEAAKLGYVEVIQCLIDHGADLTLKNVKKQTAYDLAVERGQNKSAALIKKYMEKK